MSLLQHPLSAAFPAMSADDFRALKDSINEIGVQNPITLFEGMVLDGWHRYSAAAELGMDCPSVDLGDVDPRDFVMAQNKARRHVTQAQLALATTAVYAWMPVGKPAGANSAGPAELPKTTKELAAIAGVGVRSIEQAKAIQTKAAPEVVEAVRRGEIGGEKAAKIAKLPQQEQAAAIHKPAPKKAAEPEVAADDAANDEGATLTELVDELQSENTRLTAEITAIAEADDQKAETLKWHRMYDHAMRSQADAQRQAAAHQKDAKRLGKIVHDCCRALNLQDPRQLLATVKQLAARIEAA